MSDHRAITEGSVSELPTVRKTTGTSGDDGGERQVGAWACGPMIDIGRHRERGMDDDGLQARRLADVRAERVGPRNNVVGARIEIGRQRDRRMYVVPALDRERAKELER